MDCSIIPTKYEGIFQVSTTDFFFPLVEDPYIQGKIACANVLSDMYALGLTHCDNMLMLLGACKRMNATEREVVLSRMMQGFHDLATAAGTRVTGGQTVINAWPLIGGVAMAAVKEEEFIRPENAVAGDVLVLTKPLGTQVAVNLKEWLSARASGPSGAWDRVSDVISVEEAERAYYHAMHSMSRLNKTGAELMHIHKAHAATDVTGFGLLGHASNLAANQKAKVDLELHLLPILRGMKAVDEKLGGMFSLVKGFSSETSGGLLVCLPSEEVAKAFCKELQERDGEEAWIVGRVVEGNNQARIVEGATIVEV
ncbi:Selenide, water dikinase 1 [Balamuthia mandrillaris]